MTDETVTGIQVVFVIAFTFLWVRSYLRDKREVDLLFDKMLILEAAAKLTPEEMAERFND